MARIISIDLGTHTVKVAVMQGGTEGHTLEGVYSQPVPQDEASPPTWETRLAALNSLLLDNSEWTNRSLFGASWSSVLSGVREMKLPFTDEEQINQTLPFAVESEVPFDLETKVLAWRPGSSGALKVVLAEKERLDVFISAMQAQQVNPRHVWVDAEVLGDLVSGEDTKAVIDIGHTHTTLTVVSGGQVVTWRALEVGGRSFTLAIAQALGCTYREAQSLKHGDEELTESFYTDEPTHDGAIPDEGPVFHASQANLPKKAMDAVRSVFGLLLAEVRATLIQAEDDFDLDISGVILTGGGSRIPELKGFLEQDLGVPVESFHFDEDPTVGPEYAVCLACCRHLGSESGQTISDLRVGELAYRGSDDVMRQVVKYGAISMGIFLVAAALLTVRNVYLLNQNLAEVDQRMLEVSQTVVPELMPSMGSSTMIGAISDELNSMREEVEFLNSGSGNPENMEILRAISVAFPPHPEVTVDIDKLDITPNAVTMDGVTDGFAQVDSIQQKLEESGVFASVVAKPGSSDKKGKLKFDVELTRMGAETEEGEE